MLNYLDDWLTYANSEELCRQHVALLLTHIQCLGLCLNTKKSKLQPCRVTNFLGMVLDSRRATVTLSPVRQQSHAACLSSFTLRAQRDWRVCLRLMGLKAAMIQTLALLHMRPVQRCLLSVGLCPQSPARAKVTVSQRLYRALRWWRDPANIRRGQTMGSVTHRQIVFTDASLAGWGAVHKRQGINGPWRGRWGFQHINLLELRAVCLALKHCLPRLKGQHVIVRTDSTVTAAYINRQGGLGSPALCKLATAL